MKKVRHIATFADLLILAIIVIISPTSPITPYHPFEVPCISDKVEVRYTKVLSPDSLAQSIKMVEAQLSEMKYYLKAIKSDTSDVSSKAKAIAENTEVTAHYSKISAHYAKRNAELTDALGYMVAFK